MDLARIKEVFKFNKEVVTEIPTKAMAHISVHFDNYLRSGGFPEYLLYKDPEFLKRMEIIWRTRSFWN